ncbi:MAG: nuclease-related domain-containing protein [Sulfobacillus sp.]
MALQRMEDMFPPQNHIVIFGPLVPMRNGGNKEMDAVLICPKGMFNVEMKN